MHKVSIAVTGVCLAFASNHAHAATRVVNNNTANTSSACQKAPYSTISAALTAANPGDTVSICPGSYPEAIAINKRNLTVVCSSTNNSSLCLLEPTAGISVTDVDSTAENATENTIVLVDSVTGVTINNLSVNGMLASTNCGSGNAGIYFRNASGTVENSAVGFIGLNPDGSLTGCQEGQGIYVDAANGGAAQVSVVNTSVHDFDKNGITARKAGTVLTAIMNKVTGAGPTTVTAQNGIEVAYGAKGIVNGNTVASVNYTPTSSSATAILFYGVADKSTANDNIVTDTNGLYFQGNYIQAEGNHVTKTFNWNAIGVVGDFANVEGSTITRAGLELDQAAIWLCGSKNKVTWSSINEAPIGVQDDHTSADGCSGASGNTISNGKYYNVGINTEVSTDAPQANANANAFAKQSVIHSARKVSPL